ncbi:DUF2955 domain-containing protein [Kaistia terrae]|uniref:DUF2955 domain-containing protein n=1 Tax=Kaistia terrae TaxID=537017 RepID=A0ABW0Q064_9HYPH|nr:DUF2955 domain-containing protein [Kaistia terrae]MCX5578788.1 DUF2955 domain-containing protein [Kaistia terrae]
MPADAVLNPASAPLGSGIEQQRVRNFGLRLAFAVSVGFTGAVAAGAILPFLVPMLALQFLATSPRPMSLAQIIGMALMTLVVGQAFVLLVGVFGDRPLVLLALTGLACFLCFAAQATARGGPAISLILIILVMTLVLGMAQVDLGASIVLVLVNSMLAGVILSWMAHALFPDPGGTLSETLKPHRLRRPLHRAAANAFILLAVLTLCFTNSNFSTAIVLPLTVVSLLSQADIATNTKAIGGLLVVNLFGGIVASFAFTLVSAQPTLAFLFTLLLSVGLIFGGRASDPRRGKVYAGALMIFMIIFGLGVSPIPTTAPESFATRIWMLIIAITITSCGVGLLWRVEEPSRGELSNELPLQ